MLRIMPFMADAARLRVFIALHPALLACADTAIASCVRLQAAVMRLSALELGGFLRAQGTVLDAGFDPLLLKKNTQNNNKQTTTKHQNRIAGLCSVFFRFDIAADLVL